MAEFTTIQSSENEWMYGLYDGEECIAVVELASDVGRKSLNFIVRACNAYHDLLEVAKLAARLTEGDYASWWQTLRKNATAAIAKAEGGQ